MEAKEKRKPRAYKIADKPYQKAQRRAAKSRYPLASLVEAFVEIYAEDGFVSAEMSEKLKNNK